MISTEVQTDPIKSRHAVCHYQEDCRDIEMVEMKEYEEQNSVAAPNSRVAGPSGIQTTTATATATTTSNTGTSEVDSQFSKSQTEILIPIKTRQIRRIYIPRRRVI